MAYNRILTIQDISCVGQCSLTVALPILSACGQETAILPSAVLSTHTAGFTGYTFRDLTEDMPGIEAHWEKEGIEFDAVYTGYLGSAHQIDYVKSIAGHRLKAGKPFIVDPAMADNGTLYPGFDDDFVQAMARLAFSADIILPNLTEACLLTGYEYKETYDRAYIDGLLEALVSKGAKTIVLTGIGYEKGRTGVVVYENGNYQYYEHEHITPGSHGTGDVYSASFVGALLHDHSTFDAAQIAADYTVRCIKATAGDESHWYGPKFELELPWLINNL
ncbi:MAG: pyridoxamine kinase [Actinomycetaceae bacterium]|nr:pyridoxamine kinase [Arcanobacterium sp.]MDD7504606.1 pyridoxamine kinase [Actinomycetaceae bacterium]MDY6143078.1 pyridoxamine kinase [Arcanobacterium sp.]